MATLGSVTRHSAGDLTLYHFKFTSIATTDAYAVTNMCGALGAWVSTYVGANTGVTNVNFTNSGTGVTFTLYTTVAASSASVFVLGTG